MVSNAVLSQVEALREQLNHHNYLYHTLDQAEIADAEYDAIFQQLSLIHI